MLTAEAKAHGHTPHRLKWRLVGLVHRAEAREQAYRDGECGIEHWFNYFQAVAAFPQMAVPGNNAPPRSAADETVKRRLRVCLLLAHNWANPDAPRRSYELIAREVFPRFQGHHHPTLDAAGRARVAREALAADQAQQWTQRGNVTRRKSPARH